MYLLKYTTGSVQNHPRNRRMDCAYRFWTVTLSFCKGYETLQYASWAQDYWPVRSILPVAQLVLSSPGACESILEEHADDGHHRQAAVGDLLSSQNQTLRSAMLLDLDANLLLCCQETADSFFSLLPSGDLMKPLGIPRYLR